MATLIVVTATDILCCTGASAGPWGDFAGSGHAASGNLMICMTSLMAQLGGDDCNEETVGSVDRPSDDADAELLPLFLCGIFAIGPSIANVEVVVVTVVVAPSM